MRLKQSDCQKIINILKKEFKDSKIYLFGSRVDNNQKGGDIDLYVESNNFISLEQKIKALVKLKQALGDQKIDLLINAPNIKYKKIFNIAKQTGVLLA